LSRGGERERERGKGRGEDGTEGKGMEGKWNPLHQFLRTPLE